MIDDGRFFTFASLGVLLGTAVARGSLAKGPRTCEWAGRFGVEVIAVGGERVKISYYDASGGGRTELWVDRSEISNCRPPLPA